MTLSKISEILNPLVKTTTTKDNKERPLVKAINVIYKAEKFAQKILKALRTGV